LQHENELHENPEWLIDVVSAHSDSPGERAIKEDRLLFLFVLEGLYGENYC